MTDKIILILFTSLLVFSSLSFANAQGASAPTPDELADGFIKRHTPKGDGGGFSSDADSFTVGETKVSHGDGKPSVERGPIKIEFEYDPEKDEWGHSPTIKVEDLEGELGWDGDKGRPTFSMNPFSLFKKHVVGAEVSTEMNAILNRIDEQVGFMHGRTKAGGRQNMCNDAALSKAKTMTSASVRSRVGRGAVTTAVDIIENLLGIPEKILESWSGKVVDALKDKLKSALNDFMNKDLSPQTYSNSSGGWGADCDVAMRVLWNRKAGTYNFIITGDCHCKPQWPDGIKSARPRIQLKTWTVSGKGTAKEKLVIGKGKSKEVKVVFTAKRPKVKVVANCQCAKPAEDKVVPPKKKKKPRKPKKPDPVSTGDGFEIELEDAVSVSGTDAFSTGGIRDITSKPRDQVTPPPAKPKPPSKPKPTPKKPEDTPPPQPPKTDPPPPPPAPPLQVTVSGPPRLFFTHKVGVPPEGSPCPTPAGSLRIRSNNGNPLQISNVRVSGPDMASRVNTSILDATKTSPTLLAEFNCSSAEAGSFSGTVSFTVTDTVTGETKQLSHPIAGSVR